MFLESLQFSLSVTLPTILLMGLGVILRRKRFIDDHFCNMASKVVFNFSLPVLIFFNVLRSPLDYRQDINLILTGVVGTTIIFFIAEWWAGKYISERKYRCIFTQGTYRTNAAILGLALVLNAYGDQAIASVSVYTAFLVILFNGFGVISILNSLSDEKPNAKKLALAIAKNPLISAIFVGLAFNYFNLSIPKPLLQAGQSLSSITLPIALICSGASLDFKALRQFKREGEESQLNRAVMYAALVRLFIAPTFLFLLGKWVFNLTPMQLGIIFLTATAPVAAAVYAMTRAYGGNATGAANLIGITTIGSIFTSSFGLMILRHFNWI